MDGSVCSHQHPVPLLALDLLHRGALTAAKATSLPLCVKQPELSGVINSYKHFTSVWGAPVLQAFTHEKQSLSASKKR